MCKSIALFSVLVIVLVLAIGVFGSKKDDKDGKKVKCIHQDFGSDNWNRNKCDKGEDPKGCIALSGCQNKGAHHDKRRCFDDKFRKELRKAFKISDDPKLSAACSLLQQYNSILPEELKCDSCKTCDTDSSGEYCNGVVGGIYGGVNKGVMAIGIGISVMLAMAFGGGGIPAV